MKGLHLNNIFQTVQKKISMKKRINGNRLLKKPDYRLVTETPHTIVGWPMN